MERSRGCVRDDVRGSTSGSRADRERAALPVVRAPDAVTGTCPNRPIFGHRDLVCPIYGLLVRMSEMRTRSWSSQDVFAGALLRLQLRPRYASGADCGRLAWPSRCRAPSARDDGRASNQWSRRVALASGKRAGSFACAVAPRGIDQDFFADPRLAAGDFGLSRCRYDSPSITRS